MANRQTRRYRKLGMSRKVMKGQSEPNDGRNSLNGSYAVDKPFEIFKGTTCNTAFGAKGNLHKSARGTRSVRKG